MKIILYFKDINDFEYFQLFTILFRLIRTILNEIKYYFLIQNNLSIYLYKLKDSKINKRNNFFELEIRRNFGIWIEIFRNF